MEVFNNYLINIKTNEIYDYYNCFSSYIMSKKDLRNNILSYRKMFLINYYYETNKENNKKELIKFYNLNYKDDYNTTLINHNIKYIDDEEKRDEDIELHYRSLYRCPEFYYTLKNIEETFDDEEEYYYSETETTIYMSESDEYEEEYYEDENEEEENEEEYNNYFDY